MKAATRILPWSGVLLGVSLFVVWLARPHLDGRSLSMPTRAATTRSAVTDVDGSVTAPLESRRSIATPIDEPGFFKRIVATLIGRVDVFGVVVDPAGAAVPSAIVRAKPDPTAAALDFEGAVEVRADQTGRFRLRLPAGTERVALLARADDVARGIVTLRQLGPPSWGRLDVGTVILGRRPGITGRIVDAEGRAVAGARIVPSGIRSFDEAPAVESRSLPDGTFELPCVGEGAPTPLIVSHPDYGLAIGAVARCGGEPATIVLLPSPLVHGHVRDESGSPVAGARVEALGVALFEIPRGWVDDMRSAATNADGEYRLRLVPMDDLTLMVTAFGCSRALREFSLRDGSDEEVDLALRHVGTVSGVVIDAVTGEPIEGAIVSGAASEPTPTNRAGRFVATLPDRESDWFRDATEVRLDASKPGYVRNATTLSFDDVSHEARIKLRPAARVRGLVLDPEGHPLDDAVITAAETEDWHHANTGVDGTFVFDTLRPGRYTGLWVSHPTYPRLMLPGFDVREGETREFTCVVGRGRAVCGRVVARATGAPIANANV
ncbi:MAG: carboxypeptidase regulatory-like domain-containing protein, partial [Planctomycetes bacterium]|nr:carboxypeptidase regulatory-like domain-containing protein [Planctomycetota bacterium]